MTKQRFARHMTYWDARDIEDMVKEYVSQGRSSDLP